MLNPSWQKYSNPADAPARTTGGQYQPYGKAGVNGFMCYSTDV